MYFSAFVSLYVYIMLHYNISFSSFNIFSTEPCELKNFLLSGRATTVRRKRLKREINITAMLLPCESIKKERRRKRGTHKFILISLVASLNYFNFLLILFAAPFQF